MLSTKCSFKAHQAVIGGAEDGVMTRGGVAAKLLCSLTAQILRIGADFWRGWCIVLLAIDMMSRINSGLCRHILIVFRCWKVGKSMAASVGCLSRQESILKLWAKHKQHE